MDLILSPLIKIAAEKAGNSLLEQFSRMRDMEENRKTLYRQLLAIQEKIADAEERGVNSPAMQEWMKELRAAAMKAVDVLDDLQYEALRQNVISQLPSSSTNVMKGFFSSENPILFRQKMSNKLTKVLGRINKIVIEMNTFNLAPRDRIPTIERQTQSRVIDSEVIGRDGEKEEIVNCLLDAQRERDNISVLPIVGMGGLGKTTLAQLVYNDKRVKENFQLLMWVCVSNEFNVINIIKSIIEVARNGGMSTSNKQALQGQLSEILDRKRYLLVLDDVWNEGSEWDELKTLLTIGAGSGSVIIVTTRNKGVASIMGTLISRDLTSLNEEDSWKLFAKRAFDEIGEPEALHKYGEIIVRKCGGVPLALKAMGGLMRYKRNVHEWRGVAESNTWERAEFANGILPALKLSFDELPSDTKQCFAFCAIYPQDYKIEREILIQLWMANDFIPSDGTMDLEEKGRYIFNDLYSRSFFQDMREDVTNNGRPLITCKMHDLMHDLATQIAGKKCSMMLGAQEEVEHLLMVGVESLKINSVLNQFPMIRTFLMHGFGHPQNIISSQKSCSLRALSVRPVSITTDCFTPSQKELRHMKNIRYLNLSHGFLHTLPEAISTLYHLQTLDLSYCCSIRELPENMRCMTNLRHLILDNCTFLQRMPIGLGQLSCLRTLTMFIADYGIGRNIGELKNLNLSGHLQLSHLERVRDRDAKLANLAAKTNLDSLELRWQNRPIWQRTDNDGTTENNQTVLEALTPHSELKYLTLHGYGGSSFPKWMMESLIIKNLKRLKLLQCSDCAEIPPVWQLPLLESLHLENMYKLVYVVGGTRLHAEGSESLMIFHSLMDVSVKNLPNLESWHEKDSDLIQFPKLKSLEIVECYKLKTVPIHAPLLEHLKVEDSGEIKLHQISNIPMLSLLNISVRRPLTEPEAFRLPKTLVEMSIEGFENVSPLRMEDNQSLQAASLRTLTIKRSDCFFSCGPTKMALGLWMYFAALESLQISYSNVLVFWPEEEFKGLNCLKYLELYGCKNLTGSLQAPRREDSLPRLEKLIFEDCPELVEVPCCSKSPKEIRIEKCPKISQEGMADLTNLTELKTLWLKYCDNLRALPDRMENLTSLEQLYIWGCYKFVGKAASFSKSLTVLDISDCPKFSQEALSDLTNLINLKGLSLNKCISLRALPDGMECLTSLGLLSIEECPQIESFPEGLLQHLSALQYLKITYCRALVRRCRPGGDYWHLVSRIPMTEFSDEEEANREGFLRRLIPMLYSVFACSTISPRSQ